MDSDVKAKRVIATGSLAVGPCRIRQLHGTVATGSGAHRLTITDGNGGATVLDVDAHDGGVSNTFTLEIPGNGIRCETDAYITFATGSISSVTVFYS